MTEQLQYQRGNLGLIEVICGSMSGRSEELIRRLRRAQIARQRVQILSAEAYEARCRLCFEPPE